MSRYNYFDDEPEVKQKNDGVGTKPFKRIDIKNININAYIAKLQKRLDDFVHGEVLEYIKEMPNLNAVFLKLTAFALFIISIIIFIIIFSHTINSQNKKNEQFYTDAGKVCTTCLTDYGVPKWEVLDSDKYGEGMTKLTGLCYARQMDFNSDGKDELMLCYNNRNIYTLEVWGYVDKAFTKIYSEEANKTTEDADGCWIAFYYKNNKYYICKSTPENPEKVQMLALKGDAFKESDNCDYDYKNNIYSINGKINAEDFETIRLSVIKSSRAEYIIDTVTANIDSFNTVSMAAINSSKSEADLKADAYYRIVEDRNNKYGKASIVKDKGEPYIDGVGLVDLVDFNGDGNEELLLVYRKMIRESATNHYTGERIIIEEPTYCIEAYSWNGSVANKIFSKDSISNYLNDSDVNYIILKNNDKSCDICTNTYTYKDEYNYSASSRIFSLKDTKIESVFSAREEVSWGYKNYYLDGEYTYKSEFENTAYKVPKFLNDSADYDKSKFRLVYFSGLDSDEYENTVNETIKTIESLNKNYSAAD